MPIRPIDHGIFAASGAGAPGAAYFGGGQISGGTRQTKVEKFAYPDDTRTALGTGLSAARNTLAGMANSGTAGYIGGGSHWPSYHTTMNKFAFSDDSRTTLSSGISPGRDGVSGMANSGTAG